MSEKLPTYNKIKPSRASGAREIADWLDKRIEKIASEKSWTAERVAEISTAEKAPRGRTRARGVGQRERGKGSAESVNNNRKLAEDGKKKCGTCKKVKIITEFTRHKGTWDGMDSQCRACKKEYKEQ